MVSPEGQKRGTKMRYRWAGPYLVEQFTDNKLAAKLVFADTQTAIHPWIPVSRLKKAQYNASSTAARAHLKPPEPELLETGEESYTVESIENRRWRRFHWEYLIKFVGYAYLSNEWLPERELMETCPDMIEQYNERFPKQ